MCHQNFEPLRHSGLSSVYAAEYMSNLEKVLINPFNKRSYVLCSQGSSKLKWLVRGRNLVLVVVAELWQGNTIGGRIKREERRGTHHRYVEEQGVFHLWRHRKKLAKQGTSCSERVVHENWGEGRTKTRAVPAPTPQTPRLPDHRFAVCEIVNRWHGTEK